MGQASTRCVALLRAELSERVERNPSYSLRAFARDLNMSPSRLSEVLNGKGVLSHKTASMVAERLGFNPQEKQKFCDQIDAQHSACQWRRRAAQERLEKAEQDERVYQFADDEFRFVSDWYHLAVVEIVSLRGGEVSLQELFERLPVAEDDLFAGVERLERIGLVEYDDGVVRGVEDKDSTKVGEGVSSLAMVKFHRQVLNLAKGAMVTQDRQMREFGVSIHGVGPSAIPEIKREIRAFRERLRHLAKGVGEEKHASKQVHCLSVQFFNLEVPASELES